MKIVPCWDIDFHLLLNISPCHKTNPYPWTHSKGGMCPEDCSRKTTEKRSDGCLSQLSHFWFKLKCLVQDFCSFKHSKSKKLHKININHYKNDIMNSNLTKRLAI